MAGKDSGRVTVTLYRKTVEMLRGRKKGLETWDELMWRLSRKRRCGIECISCGKVIETTDATVSPAMLVKRNRWQEIHTGKVKLDSKGKKVGVELGYICAECNRG